MSRPWFGQPDDSHAPMNSYLWTKILHLWLVVGWMATVLGLPLLLLAASAPDTDPATRDRFLGLGRRIYQWGHHLFGWAFLCGLVLWLHFGIGGTWLHVKWMMIGLLLAHFTVCGRWIKRARQSGRLPSPGILHGLAWWPMFLLAVVIWLVLAKPF